METNRLKLQDMLEELVGSRNVYYQPPSSLKMKYPAIVYDIKRIDDKHANNSTYNRSFCYEITVIDYGDDDEIVDKVLNLPMCSFQRHFTSDNLNHNVFELYY